MDLVILVGLSDIISVNYTYTCFNCGRIFGTTIVRHNKHTFCSKECSDKWQRNGKYVHCNSCGALIYRSDERLIHCKKSYCSLQCAGRDIERNKEISERFKGNKNWLCVDYKANGKKISQTKLGHEVSLETRAKLSKAASGSNSAFYIDGRSKERQLFYRSFLWRLLAKQVRIRDNYRCQNCGAKAIGVHHIIPRSLGGPDELWNLITICRACHPKLEWQSNPIKI